jgi:hypothetical protein
MLTDYAQAGHDGRTSEKPPYDSSPNGMAYSAGVWCRAHGIYPHEATQSRGYSIRINRDLVLLNCDNLGKITVKP